MTNLANGRHYLAIPGPSVMPDRVLQAMHQPAPNIYEGKLHNLVETLIPDLKQIACTRHSVAMYICNGHGTWEACLANTLSRDDQILVLVTGRFGRIWGEVARALGIRTDIMDFGLHNPVDLDMFAEKIAGDKTHSYKAVLVCQTDTATSVRNDVQSIGKILKEQNHPALLMVDAMASLGCDRLEMDDWNIDIVIAGSQKGLMTPPGLGFVWFSERADEAHKRSNLKTPYWDWAPRARPSQFYEFFYGTAPTHHLFGLREALNIILEEGLPQVWNRHAVLSKMIWDQIDIWSMKTSMKMNIQDPHHRSHSVTAVSMDSPLATKLRRICEQDYGVTLGIGLGMAEPGTPEADGYFRIGHMGHVNAHMVKGLLGCIDLALEKL